MASQPSGRALVALTLALGATVLWNAASGPGGSTAALLAALGHPDLRLGDAGLRAMLASASWLAWGALAGAVVAPGRPAWRTAYGRTSAGRSAPGPPSTGQTRAGRHFAAPSPASVRMLPPTTAADPQLPERPRVLSSAGSFPVALRRRATMPPTDGPDADNSSRPGDRPRAFADDSASSRCSATAKVPTTPTQIESTEDALFCRPPPEPWLQPHLEMPEWTRALLGLAYQGPETGAPLFWRLGPDRIDAFAVGTSPAPPPFSQLIDGCWTLQRDTSHVADLKTADVMRAASRSALVTLWSDGASRGLLDVIAARTVALDGPPVAVGYTLSDIVVELASARWSDVAEVYLVGMGKEMHGLENVRYLRGVAEATYELSALGRHGDDKSRCFVLAPPIEGPDRAAVNGFLRLAEQIPLTGVVCCDTSVRVQCTWRLAAHRCTTSVTLNGRLGASAVVTPSDWVDLIGARPFASSRAVPLGHEGSAGLAPRPAAVPLLSSTAGMHDHRTSIEVGVLGPVKLSGLPTELDRRWRISELIVYLALHPEGATGEACAEAVWPGKRLPRQTFSNRVSEARQVLGCSADGKPRLSRVEGKYVLSNDIRTDWWKFRRWTGEGSDSMSWVRAMALVRGRPFGGLAAGDWTTLEGHATEITAAITDLAIRLAETQLASDDARSAEWALRRAILVAPFEERLHRLLMRANYALGNLAGVEDVIRQLAASLDRVDDPLGGVHPETAALYRRLVSRRSV
jgi:DNA-binding SARP family transcriptional activator